MDLKKYIKNNEQLVSNNKFLKFIISLLCFVIIFCVYEIGTVSNNQKTILIPMGLSNKISVGNTYIDEEYLQAMGVYISTLLYSTTPTSVKTQYQILTSLFDEDAYKEYGEELLKTASSHSKNMVSLSMKINKITIETSPKQYIKINLNVDKYIFGAKSEQSFTHTIQIGFIIKNGKFYINSLTEEKNEKQ